MKKRVEMPQALREWILCSGRTDSLCGLPICFFSLLLCTAIQSDKAYSLCALCSVSRPRNIWTNQEKWDKRENTKRWRCLIYKSGVRARRVQYVDVATTIITWRNNSQRTNEIHRDNALIPTRSHYDCMPARKETNSIAKQTIENMFWVQWRGGRKRRWTQKKVKKSGQMFRSAQKGYALMCAGIGGVRRCSVRCTNLNRIDYIIEVHWMIIAFHLDENRVCLCACVRASVCVRVCVCAECEYSDVCRSIRY